MPDPGIIWQKQARQSHSDPLSHITKKTVRRPNYPDFCKRNSNIVL